MLAYSICTLTLTKQDKTQSVELNVTRGTEVEIIINFKYTIRGIDNLSLHRALWNLYIVHSPTIALFIKLGEV